MSVREELLAALAYLRVRTGDPNSWQLGLSPQEVTAVVSPATRPEQLEPILGTIRRQHPDIFAPTSPITGAPAPNREQGATADAVAHAEAALAQQNTASAQLDMQVVTAILNAHLKSLEGSQSLTTLQREIEAAVQGRSDLDTPAGARDFQRFLIGKLRDIRAVLLDASLDDASKSALMTAWTSLYEASKGGAPTERESAQTLPAGVATDDDAPGSDWNDPLLDAIPPDDPGPMEGAPSAPMASAPAAPMPNPPGVGAGSIPGFGAAPGSMGGLGLPLPPLQDATRADPALRKLADENLLQPDDPEGGSEHDDSAPDKAPEDEPGSAAAMPTTVTLPDGETATAPTPELAAVIRAAVSGVPIADAFRQQGITIPTAGTPVSEPLDPLRLAPGDIGIFTDRHALALSPGKALVDGQIQQVATVSGPTFLGWEHPPVATASATAPAQAPTPAPTRPTGAPVTAEVKPAGPPGGA